MIFFGYIDTYEKTHLTAILFKQQRTSWLSKQFSIPSGIDWKLAMRRCMAMIIGYEIDRNDLGIKRICVASGVIYTKALTAASQGAVSKERRFNVVVLSGFDFTFWSHADCSLDTLGMLRCWCTKSCRCAQTIWAFSLNNRAFHRVGLRLKWLMHQKLY